MIGTKPNLRGIPLTIIDSNKPVTQEAHDHHHDKQGEGARSLGQPAPCYLFVGGLPISEAQIAQEMQYHRALTPEHSRADAARALVVRELLRLEVERLGLVDEVQSVAQETSEEACIRLLLEREIVDRVPTQDDCQRYYEQNLERFHSPDRVRVRHILLGAAADDITGRFNARSEGERLINELKSHPEWFTNFAMRHSDCPSKEQGGELGWLQRGQTTPEFDRQIFRLHEGLTAFPVESRWGYHVVSIDELSPGTALPFEKVHTQIAEYLELQVRQRELQHYLQSLQERYEVHGLREIEALVA